MPRRGENIYKRKDGRWEGRYIKGYSYGKAQYGYVYASSYAEVKEKLFYFKMNVREPGIIRNDLRTGQTGTTFEAVEITNAWSGQ